MERSGRLFVGSRVTGVSSSAPIEVETTGGQLLADRVVLATGAPVLDRGSRSTRLEPQRSYAIALQPTDAAVPPP